MPRPRVTKVTNPPEEPTPAAAGNAGAGTVPGPVPTPVPTSTEALKIVIQLRPPHAMIGVSQPGKDPHLVSLEMLDAQDLAHVLEQVPKIVEVARARFETTPQYPKYTGPAPAPRAPAAPRAARTPPARPTAPAGPTQNNLF